MALSGSAVTRVAEHWQLVLEWNASQSIPNNQSTITARLYWQSLDGHGISSRGPNDGNIVINGTTHSFSGSGLAGLNGTQKKLLYAVSQTISHNADGSKSVGVSGTFAMKVTLQGTYYGSRSVSLTANLDTIPRATTPQIPGNFNLGDTVTINLPRASGSFTHNLSVDLKTGTWEPIASGVGTSYQWTVPASYADRITNALAGNGRLRCDTLSGGSTIGGAVVVPFTVHIPGGAEYQPTISSIGISEAVSGLAAQFGGYVQGRSKLKIQTTAAGAHGSSIVSYRHEVGSTVDTGNPVTTDVLPDSGSVTIVTMVTDSRGRTASKTNTVNVLPYEPPKITEFSILRADSAGKEDNANGKYVRARMKFAVAPVNNKNTKSWKLQYKKQAGSTWTTLTSGSVYAYDGVYVSTAEILGLEDSYDLQLTVSDYFTFVSIIYKVGTAFTLLDFGANGRGVATGKVYEGLATFEISKTALIKDQITGAKIMINPVKGDMVWRDATVINGWSGSVRYRKNPFGQLELYGHLTPGTVPGVAAILPEGYRPPELTPIACAIHNTGSIYNGLALHGAGGLQVYRGDMQSGTRYDFNAIMPLPEGSDGNA